MSCYSVRFKGMLTKDDRRRLTDVGIEIVGSKPSMTIDSVQFGRPIHTAEVEASSAEEARAKVRDALEPDTSNFSNWEAGPA